MPKRLKIVARMTLCAALALGLSSVSCEARPVLGPGDDDSPYRLGLKSPRLTTPQWVGDPGVEAVVILSIDDLTDNAPKYQAFLQPIMARLKQIDGRTPISILTCRTAPDAPGVAEFVKAGVHFDIHTLKHPCPLFQNGDFGSAASNYHDCVDLVSRIPGQKPVAFRMPCCDSQNTVSPRFFSQIFNEKSREGRSLTIDSSVFTILTPDDPALPRSSVLQADGSERFRKYMPVGKSFVNLIENYPYPFTIHRLAWEFPCIVPSDWEAQNTHRPNNPKTTEDLKAALDGVVAKQGVFTFVFHPHGWISSEMVVALIDHAVAQHGPKVKFLTFQEAQDRIDRNLLKGNPLRLSDGTDGGVRITDLNGDGYMDVLIGSARARLTRVFDPKAGRWIESPLPVGIVDAKTKQDAGTRSGKVKTKTGSTAILYSNSEGQRGLWRFSENGWRPLETALEVKTVREGIDQGVRFVDLDGDGTDELIAAGLDASAVYRWEEQGEKYVRTPCVFPGGITLVDERGADLGTRFVDLDEDGHLDLFHSNETREAIYLFDPVTSGWTRKAFDQPDSPKRRVPPIVRGGKDLGAWFANRHLWVQNEDTAGKPDLVDRRSFATLLEGVEPTGKTVDAALRSFEVEPGFRVDLAASEPLVADPIAFDWGADGRLWVVEMGDYPLGLEGKGTAGGKVRVLEDTNGDGRYDRASTFLDGLSYPTGILPWRKGALIASAPDIFYAEDADGDGRAEVKRILYSGFAPGNPQHRVNGFSLGLDGWVYAANGDSGGKVKSTLTGKTVSISGRDFRFKPDTGEIEPESGQTQYGRWRDDWGRWFGNNNSEWGWHYVLNEADIARNPAFRFTGARQPLGVPTRVFPISPTLPRFNMPGSANHVTSANSPTPYRDDLFGPAFANALFVSEPVHNLVRWIALEPNGPTLIGRIPGGHANREFLASSDNWFRPTSMRTGPDGALWVADMYRAVIEHPEWIPDEWEARIDLRAGQDAGRIYRVFPRDRSPRPIARLDQLDTQGLVNAFESPNGWTRDTAQRLLQEYGGTESFAGLSNLATNSLRARTRLQALWTLANLGGLTADVGRKALSDQEPQVRRSAVRLALPLAAKDEGIATELLRLTEDPDPAVRLELACALGDWSDRRAGDALARIAQKDAADPWIRAAVLTSARPHAATLLTRLFKESGGNPPGNLIEPLFASLEPGADSPVVDELCRTFLNPQPDGKFAPWQFAAVVGLSRSGRLKTSVGAAEGRSKIELAIRAALQQEGDDSMRLPAIQALTPLGFSPDDVRVLLKPLLSPQTSSLIRRTAIEELGRSNDPKVATLLLEGWKGHAPATRDQVMETLLSRPVWTGALLSSLEDTCTPAQEVGGLYRDRLLRNADATVRERAARVFEASVSARQTVLDKYQAALSLKADANNGAAVFTKTCATCHRSGGLGVEVGPDLSTVGDKPPEALLVAIIDPNRAFETRYTSYAVALADGRVLTGLVSGESANAITLRKADGKEDVVPRSEIESLVGSGRSLMPEGLEQELSLQQVADLLAFLKKGTTPPKAIDGNRPALVKPEADGSIRLVASSSELRGEGITFESQYKNIGFWTGENDRVTWSLLVPRAGRYEIRLEYACPSDAAGDELQLEIGHQSKRWKVLATSSWDDYRNVALGQVDLTPGEVRLEIRPVAKPHTALLDLKRVDLIPIP